MGRRGDEGAAIHVPLASASFEEFFASEYPRLIPLLHPLVGERAHAEAIAMNVLDEVRRRWDEVSADQDLAWSTHRKALQRATRRSPRTRRGGGDATATSTLPDPELWAAVRRLPRREQFVVALHYVDFMPLGEVAAVIGCTPSTLTSLMTSAHASLAKSLPADGSASPRDGSPFERIDARLRTAGDLLRASAPDTAESAGQLTSVRAARRRRWIVPVSITTAAAATTLAVVVVSRGDDTESAPSDSVPVTVAPPPTSGAPSTITETSTTFERIQIIEPAPRFEARYDRPTGYMWISSNWDWDGENGSCITLSRPKSPPAPEDLESPENITGCVEGGRHDVVLTARIGRRLIHLTKDFRANDWNLAALPFGLRLCDATTDELGLEPRILYEVACTRSGVQIRRFGTRPDDPLTIIDDGGTALTAKKVFDGDEPSRSGRELYFGMDAPGLDIYVTSPPSAATTCYIATVAGKPGWYDACAGTDTPGGFLLVADRASYLIRHDGPRVSAAEVRPAPDGTSVGCNDGQLRSLRHVDSHGIWDGVACAGSVLLATQPPGLSRPDPDAHTEYWVAAVDGGRWQTIVAGDEASARTVVRCGGGMPCSEAGRVSPLPVGAIPPWGYGTASMVDDVTADVRALVGGPTDLATIGIRVSEHPPGSGGRPVSTVDDFDSFDIAIGPRHRYLDEDIRIVTTTYFNPNQQGRSIYFVVWTTREPRSRDWSVRAAYRVTNCFTETGNPVSCDDDR
jgi:DNA-directed RNA polymerase specialized sigma24 family protein